MKRILSLFLTLILVVLLSACQQSTNTIKYHSNKTINELINSFNEITEDVEITQEMVREDAYNFSANISVNDVWIMIYDNRNNLFVDYQLESTDDTSIGPLFYGFTKATNPSITDDEISLAWSKLQTNNYQNYDYYEFDKFQCTYSKQKLVNGEHRYTIKTGYKN